MEIADCTAFRKVLHWNFQQVVTSQCKTKYIKHKRQTLRVLNGNRNVSSAMQTPNDPKNLSTMEFIYIVILKSAYPTSAEKQGK